ncbi:MAG: SDR family NAD(P)-dependent oxidoreductase [Chloroflexi bacterium]|nr:SDR family NAD(P)-dependent oxidoreductase [Chloroflexota bacterium]
MSNRLKGKNAVVTGAGSGIGRETALALAREGANVVVNDLGGDVAGTGGSQRPADLVVAEIKALGSQAVANYDSVADFKAAERIIDTCVRTFGRIDILCNIAGTYIGRMIWNMSEEEYDLVYKVHLKGTFNCSRHASVHMRRQRYGRIVNVTSSARMGSGGASVYGAAKGGIASLTLAVARELGRYGVTCNAIAPWATTRLLQATGLDASRPEAATWLAQEGFTSAEGVTGPEYVPPIIVYLCTDYASNVNSQIFPCSGGRIARTEEPVEIRGIYKDYKKDGPWTLDELIEMVPKVLLKKA